MKKQQRERIIKRHHHSVWMHGYSPQALYWENRDVQNIRFDVLFECGVKSGDSVLDVGCGFADLYHYMLAKGISTEYTGIDLSPDMIEVAQTKSSDITLFEGDLFDFDPPDKSVDWVMLSGALNEPLQDEGEYLRRIIPRLFRTCKKGLAFNLLNDDFAWPDKDRYILQAYKPDEVMRQLGQLSNKTLLRTDYLDVDASYFIWRE